jgi:cob(I)alamin adenosyltransferase
VAAAQHGLHVASKELSNPSRDVVVLDEVLTAMKLNLIEEEAILGAIANAASDTIIILTGRGASPKILSIADTATEMRCIKHAYDSGRVAQKGVEF